jgi:HD-GYP domain-containing protein (c-di-GMP phosphodiesterase class II)
VLRNNQPYLGDEMEYGPNSAGELIPKLDIIAPLTVQQQIIGGMEVELDLRRTMLLIQQRDGIYESELVGSTLLASLVLLFFIVLVVYRWLVRPVRVMAQGTALIASGRFDTRIRTNHRDELGNLASSINRMAHSLKQLFNEQENAYMEALKALTMALEAKDAYTAGHSGRVAHYAKLLGKRIELADEALKLLHQGALMHDLGKIGIPDNILNKAGKLDEHEYEIMQQHPHYTYTIMRPLKRFKAFADIARWHHERWDGAGYPDGLVGEQIPLLARIVSIADTWDAMTGDRIYRKGMPAEQALSTLEQEKDLGQWDPQLLASFIDMVRAEQRSRHKDSP